MKDKLLLATKCKKTIEYIIKAVENYPHKYSNLKNNIINTSFSILESIYNGNIDFNYKKTTIPKIQMLDYYLKLSYKYDIISKKNMKLHQTTY